MNISDLRDRGEQYKDSLLDMIDPRITEEEYLKTQIDLACIELVRQGLVKYTVQADGEINWFDHKHAPECALGWEQMRAHFSSVKKLNL